MSSFGLRAAADEITLPHARNVTETLAELQDSLQRHAEALRSLEANASRQLRWSEASITAVETMTMGVETMAPPPKLSPAPPRSDQAAVLPGEVDGVLLDHDRDTTVRFADRTSQMTAASHFLMEDSQTCEPRPWPPADEATLNGLARISAIRSGRSDVSNEFRAKHRSKSILQSLRPAAVMAGLQQVAVTRKPKDGKGWRLSGNVFPDVEEMKKKARDFVCVKEKHVSDEYYETGCMQAIAKNSAFELCTFVVILANAFYLAFEVSMNEAEVLNNAHPVIQVFEHSFCALFTLEWLIRFLAFKHKHRAFHDQWFIFDTVLVSTMILETWVFTAYIAISQSSQGANMGATSILRIGRLVRISRVARIGRLFRAFPEIMLIIRSLMITVRTVSLIMFVLLAFVYMFAIILTQLCKGTGLGKTYFPNVPTAMFSLTLGAIFPDMADFTNQLGATSPLYAALFLLFTVFTTIIVMNMLIGALVEVVGVVAAVEREQNEAMAVKDELHNVLGHLDADNDGTISRAEFQKVLEDPVAVLALHKVGVDACGLVETAHIVFHDKEELAFEEILETLLCLRGANATKVSDLTSLRRYFHSDIRRLEDNLSALLDPGSVQPDRCAKRFVTEF